MFGEKMSEKKEIIGRFGTIYRIYYKRKLIGMVTDLGEGLIDFIRDANPEIRAEEAKPK